MRDQLYGLIGWLCFCLFAAPALVHAAAPHPIPEAAGLIVDQVGALSDAEREALETRLKSIQSSGRAQVAILISGGTGGEALADYALRVAESWQLGRAKRDDGLLVLVVPSTAAVRIEVGYGLEGAIPDARASQWLDDLLPAIKNKELAKGLDHLLDQIDGALPIAAAKTDAGGENVLFDDHPEWAVPFVLAVFSLFALFPLFMGRWGFVASGPLLAAFLGGAAFTLWGLTTATLAVAGVALVLPFLWSLNREGESLAPWLRYARAFGNLMAVAMFFAVITLFTGVGLSAVDEPVWPGAVFAGMLAMGVAVFLFPGKPAQYLGIVLANAMYFVFILVVAYVALAPFIPDPFRIAFAAAATVSACVALGLCLDRRERARGSAARGEIRWSLWFYGLALVVAFPFGLLALILSVGGEDLQMQIAQAAAGGGTIAGILALAARIGLITAVKVGLGGRFGGGGAGRSG